MGDSFKLEDQYRRRKNKNYLSFKFLFIVIIVVFLLYIISAAVYHTFFYIEKKDKSKEYVYTLRKDAVDFQDNVYSRVPCINLQGEEFDKINKNILTNYEKIILQNDYDYDYEYSKSKNILSLKISYSYFNDNEENPTRYFKTYNINLNDGHVYTDQELLKKYHISEERLNEFIKTKFQGYYNDLVKYKYFSKNECDYKCYLKNRGISEDYLEDSSLYVDDGSLVLYKYFKTYSKFEEEGYFTNVTYRFIVKK